MPIRAARRRRHRRQEFAPACHLEPAAIRAPARRVIDRASHGAQTAHAWFSRLKYLELAAIVMIGIADVRASRPFSRSTQCPRLSTPAARRCWRSSAILSCRAQAGGLDACRAPCRIGGSKARRRVPPARRSLHCESPAFSSSSRRSTRIVSLAEPDSQRAQIRILPLGLRHLRAARVQPGHVLDAGARRGAL